MLSLQMLPVAGTPMFGSVTMAGVFLAAGVVMVLLTARMALMSRTVVRSLCGAGGGAEWEWLGAQGRVQVLLCSLSVRGKEGAVSRHPPLHPALGAVRSAPGLRGRLGRGGMSPAALSARAVAVQEQGVHHG